MQQSKADYEEVLAQRLAALLVAAWRCEQAGRDDAALRPVVRTSLQGPDLPECAEADVHPTSTTDAA